MSDQPHCDSAAPGEGLSFGVSEAPIQAAPIQTAPTTPRFSLPPAASKPTTNRNGHGAANPPPQVRELLAVVAAVVLCDLAVYRGQGFAGCAALFAALPLLLCLGSPRPTLGWRTWLMGGLLLLLAAKLAWCGSGPAVAIGLGLTVAFAMALYGQSPQVLGAVAFGGLAIVGGVQGLAHYGRSLTRESSLVRLPWIEVLLPALALVLFGGIFILANPDLVASVSRTADAFFASAGRWLAHFSVVEVAFWGMVIWLVVGLLRPASVGNGGLPAAAPTFTATQRSPLYAAFRNTLLTVIGLFAAYLLFEYQTLWFREFPAGFHYSGYAHQGAAWLTFALALATAVLSLVFRGSILRDPRLPFLRTLAWIWSAFNLLMAVAIYNRMFLYVDFNGLTRMRMVGFFGITTVVIGFLWVIWKIARQRDFAWLIRRHLWTLAAAIYLFVLTPIDTLVVRYNVRQILSGDVAPSVQISVHPINAEGLLELMPLVNCPDAIIREGVLAMLAQRDDEAESLARKRARLGWTAHQVADQRALLGLRAQSRAWQRYQDLASRQEALARFRAYAYQWY